MANSTNYGLIFLLIGMMLVTGMSVASATGVMSIVDTDEYDSTTSAQSDDWLYIQNSVCLIDKIKMAISISGQPLTVIDGATCSLYPDRSDKYTAKTTRFCHTENDHIGTAFKLFRIISENPYNVEYLGDRKVLKGEKQCFNTVIGERYYWTLYYCDDIDLTRACSDSDDLDYYTKGSVTFSTNPYDVQSFEDSCTYGEKLSELYCDSDNSVETRRYTCPYKCEDGRCIAEPVSSSIQCYALMAGCELRTVTVDVGEDCSAGVYSNQKVYESKTVCMSILFPDTENGDDSGDVSGDECSRDSDCTNRAKVTYDDGSDWYHDYQCDNGYCDIGMDVVPTNCISNLHDHCDEWISVQCVGDRLEMKCYDTNSEQYKDVTTVKSSACEQGATPPPQKFNMMDWLNNNVMIVSGVVVGGIMLFTIMIIVFIFIRRK